MKQRIVEVNSALVKRLEVSRLDQGGFQRPLNRKRIGEMVSELGEGTVCPPIVVANTNGKLLVVDGQHRLEAWKVAQFPLYAFIFEASDGKKAAQTFVDINSKAVRVGRRHIITISDDDWSYHVRTLAKQLGRDLMVAHHAMVGAARTGGYSTKECKPTPLVISVAGTVIASWMRDPRYEKEDNGCFDKPGTMAMAAHIIRSEKEKNWPGIVKKLLSLEYGPESGMSLVYGSGFYRIKQMVKLAEKYLREQHS